MKAFWSRYGRGLTVAAVIVAAYGLLFALGGTCPIKAVLGISCPGCGMTRACLHAVRLDLAAAFYYHPLWVLLLPFAVTCLLLWRRGKVRPLRIIIACGIALMLAVWLWRMLAHVSGDVVVFRPQDGWIGRGIGAILGVFSE